MELRNLTTFLKVAELQSFSKAALHLGYAQSTITAQIQQLEQELQVSLFERIGKQIQITEAGEKLLPYARQMLHLSWEAQKLTLPATEITGHLHIGIVESLQNCLLPAILHNFRKEYPQVSVSVKASDCQTLSQLLYHNEIDLMYVFDVRLRNPDLVTAWEEEEPMYFAASPSHPLFSKENLTLEDLLSGPFLETEPDLSFGLAIHNYFAKQGLTLKSRLQIGNPDIIVQLMESGDGVSFLPQYVLEKALTAGTLKILPLDTDISMWKQILYHKNKWVTKAMEGFSSIASVTQRNSFL